jgi:riboflavin kinase/FMN adenylyltransferase
MMNIGNRPTINGLNETIEIHIFDFDKDIYGKNLKVCFLKKIRKEKKFDSLTSLKNQLKKDEENCKRILAEDSEN